MVSSLAKLCVHQILVVLRPFFGLSVAAEGCEGEEGAAAGPFPGKGGGTGPPSPGCPPHLAAGDERGRGDAVQRLQVLQHSRQLLQLGLALRQLCQGHGGQRGGTGHPLPGPTHPLGPRSPAEQRSSPSLSFSQAFTLSWELASVDRAGALPEGRIRVHWPCRRAQRARMAVRSHSPRCCHLELSPTCALGPPWGHGSGRSPWWWVQRLLTQLENSSGDLIWGTGGSWLRT